MSNIIINSEIDSSSEYSSDSCYDKSLGEEFYGKVLKGEYMLIDKIGSGTFSAVWLSLNILNGKLYAIKIQHLDDYKEGKKEALILNKLNSKYLPLLHNVFDVENPIEKDYLNICIVMDLYVGSVSSLLDIRRDGLELEVSRKIIRNVVEGLMVLNEVGYIHTDIKPQNILIKGKNEIFNNFINYVINNRIIDEINEEIKKLKNEYNLLSYEKGSSKYKRVLNKVKENKEKIYDNVGLKLRQEFRKICNNYLDEGDKIDINDDRATYYKLDFNKQFLLNLNLMECDYILSDFGSIKKMSKQCDEEIQTRYYMAPEVLFRCVWDKSVDIWSIGCLFFELMTGDVLFDPSEEKGKYDEDTHHICLMLSICNMDVERFKNGRKYYKYVDKKGKFILGYEKQTINECLYDSTNTEFDGQTIEYINYFLNKVLVEPKNRISCEEMLKIL